MFKKIFMIVTPIIAIIILIFVFGINSYNNSYKKFQKDGYVIDSDVQKKVFFSENDNYKIVDNAGYIELNTSSDNKENKVSESTFVHYVDGSISTFKKAVFLDLDSMNKETFQYYNIFPSSIISSVSSGYKINYLDTSLTLKNMLMKISSTKYLVAVEKMELTLKNGDVKVIENSYLEINYLDGNIIRLDNQEISIQSVASELELKLNNDVTLDLVNKKIYYKDEEKLNLGEITINSDDNIEIIQSEDNTVILEEEEEKKEVNKNLPRITDGKITVKPNDGIEEIIDETAKIRDANFAVLDFDTNANSLKANIQIDDPDGVLTGPKVIKIIKTGTNEVVYYENDVTGKASIPIDIETLKPDTNYTLVINQDYIKNGVTFNRDFVQKSFVTSSLGLTIEKDYVREDSLAVIVSKNSFSEVKRFDYTLTTESGQAVKSGTVEFEVSDDVSLVFQNLTSNTKYLFKTYNFVYGNIMVTDDTNESIVFKTLKIKPTVGKTSFSVDKQNNKFSLYLNNVKDPDNGITLYRADIYQYDNLILSKSATPTVKIDIPVDDNLITRHTDYRAYVTLLFDDNEKVYEIPIGSDVMNLNASNRGPIVTFKETEVTWESIKGNVFINDADDAIDNTQDVIVTYQNLTISTDPVVLRKHNLEKTGDEEYLLPLEVNNLKANDTYLFTIKASVDYNDENGYSLVDIGQFLVQTGMPNKMAAEFVDQESRTEAFSVKAKLKSASVSEDTTLEANTMTSITIKLYKSGYDTSKPCIKSNECWSKVFYDEDSNAYVSTLKDMIYFPNTNEYFVITPSTLDIQTTDLTYGIYNLEITDAKDYTIYKNDLPIINNIFSVTPSNIQEQIINVSSPLKIKEIENKGTIETLERDTIIGYTLTPNIILSQESQLTKIEFFIYDSSTRSVISQVTKTPSSNTDISQDVYFDGSQFKRGGTYYFVYVVSVLKEGEVTDYESPESSEVSPRKETPKFDFYLSSRDSVNSIWKYTLKDVDNALVDGVLYYYFGTNEPTPIEVTRNATTLSELAIPTVYGRLNVYHLVLLNNSESPVRMDDISFYFAPLIENLGNIDYTVTQNVNQAVITLDLNDSIKNNVIAANLELSAGSETVTLEQVPVIAKKIYVDFGKIRALKSKGDISTKISLYYDTNISGLDNSGASVIQDATEQYVYVDDENIFDYTSFSFSSKIITYYTSVGRKQLTYIPSNGYVVMADNKIMFKKIAVSSDTITTCTENCTFAFDSITPSFNLPRGKVEPSFFEITVKPEITSYDEEKKDSINVFVTVYNRENDVCGTQPITKQSFPLTTILESATITGLRPNREYCLNFTWQDDTFNETHFYYPSLDSYENTYNLGTLQSVNVINFGIKYIIYSERVRGRYLDIYYRANVIEGYSGIKYRITNAATNEEVISVSDTSISEIYDNNGEINKIVDINERLEAGVRYNIELMPYAIVDGAVEVFESYSTQYVLTINEPKFVFTRSSDLEEGRFSFRVSVSDSSNALNRYRLYDIYVKQNGNEGIGELLQSNVSTLSAKSYTIDCPTGSCTVTVKYQEDITNTGVYVEKQKSNKFNLIQTFEIGEVIVAQASNNSVVRLGFLGSYNLNAIDKIDYTIYNVNDDPIAASSITDIVFTTDSEGTYYLDLHENLDNGTYQLVIQFQGSQGNVVTRELTYIKS